MICFRKLPLSRPNAPHQIGVLYAKKNISPSYCLCTYRNLSLSRVNVFSVLRLLLLSSIPEFTAEIVGTVVEEFIKKLVKLVIDIGSKNNKRVNQKTLEIKTYTKDALISVVVNAYIGPKEEAVLPKISLF